MLATLERRLPKQTFDTWFRPLAVDASPIDRVFTFSAPNPVVKDWVVTHYGDLIQQSLRDLALENYQIEWSLTRIASEREADVPGRSPRAPGSVSAEHIPIDLHEGDQIGQSGESIPSALNEKYTFSNFVVASCNRFAHAAAKAVAESPGQTYNPLYLYGGVGLGKTHLIQATGHAIRTLRPDLQVAYLSLERFMNELINAIRYGYDKTRLFRERYRSIDVLLIDDVQFIAGKERTQEEFFHTFNAL
ncbi:MAG: chromosomal replication initiator protein DnaA, partial [Acidobacteria bacterium]